jgi:hypothetical protein
LERNTYESDTDEDFDAAHGNAGAADGNAGVADGDSDTADGDVDVAGNLSTPTKTPTPPARTAATATSPGMTSTAQTPRPSIACPRRASRSGCVNNATPAFRLHLRERTHSEHHLFSKPKGLKPEKNAGISKIDEDTFLITTQALKKLSGEHRGNEETVNVAEVSEKAATLNDLTRSSIGVGGEQMGTNKAAAPMRALSERLVAIYDIVATEKVAENLFLKELQECPENLWRRVAETEAGLNAERVTHTETRRRLKELIVVKEDGVSPEDVSHSPVIEVGEERDTCINSSAAASMTEFREVKTTTDDFRVELEVKN